MSGCNVERCVVEGWAALRLENAYLRCEVLPELGGKVWNLWHKPSGIQWIWHNPRTTLRAVAPSSQYDDVWAGGWEELFPNDAPGAFEGRLLSDHGEWWSQRWDDRILLDSSEAVEVALGLKGLTTPTKCEKRVRLERDTSAVRVTYDIQNQDARRLRFLFKQHLAVAVTPDHELELPGGIVTPVDLAFSTRIGTSNPSRWPYATSGNGHSVDLRTFPPASAGHREFVYVSELPEGWCGVRHKPTSAAIRLHFEREQYPYTWLFMTFGGWNDLYTVVLEPCTNMPKDLAAASALGRCASVEGYECVRYDVRVELS